MSVEGMGYAVILAVFGVAIIIYSLVQRSRLRASENWPQVMGTITKAAIVNEVSNDSTGYSLNVVYDYAVNGQRYTGKRIEFGRRSYNRKKTAEAQLDRYPVNSSVVVYFNPDKPDEAVLVRTAPYQTLYLVMGVLSIGFVIAIVLLTAGKK